MGMNKFFYRFYEFCRLFHPDTLHADPALLSPQYTRLSAALLLAAVVFLLPACAGPVVTYEDPLAQIGRGGDPQAVSPYKNLVLGVIFTENTRKAMGLSEQATKLLNSFGPLANREALADNDPAFLTKAIDEALRRRFKDVLILPDTATRRPASVDAVMFLDIQITMGSRAGNVTRVALQGIFVDEAQAPLGQVKGEGSATIPFPASTFVFKPAAAQAVERFARELDATTELAGKLGSRTPEHLPAAISQSPPLVTALIPTSEGERSALVIGNSAYGTGPLKNPVNDAADMAATLKKLGFAVTLKNNATLQEMDEAIEAFGNRLKRGGVGLFYYAGHGVQVNGTNYLIPIGARINKEADVKYQAVDANRILDEMANANNGLNIVMLDACRDNPFARSFRSAARGLAVVSNAPSGTFISYSTSPGNVARDGDGRNSPYTAALLTYMQTPGMTISDMFINVRVKLKKETGQVPWELSSLEGQFYFLPK
jgi:hypothetical protein